MGPKLFVGHGIRITVLGVLLMFLLDDKAIGTFLIAIGLVLAALGFVVDLLRAISSL